MKKLKQAAHRRTFTQEIVLCKSMPRHHGLSREEVRENTHEMEFLKQLKAGELVLVKKISKPRTTSVGPWAGGRVVSVILQIVPMGTAADFDREFGC